MATWPAILSGILQGAGGFPKGLQQAEELSLRDRQLQEIARQREENRSLREQDLSFRREQLAETTRHHEQQLPNLLKQALFQDQLTQQAEQRKQAASLARGQRLAEAVDPFTSGQPVEAPEIGAEGQPVRPLTAEVDPRHRVIQGALRTGAFGDAPAEKLFELLGLKPPKPPEPYTLNLGAKRFDEKNRLVAEGGPKEEKQPPAHVYIDRLSQEYQDAVRTYGKHDPRAVAIGKRIDTLRSFPLTEGGLVIGGGTREPIAKGPPKPPESSERENISRLNALVTLGRGLVTDLEQDPKRIPSTLERLGEREFGLGLKPSDLVGQTQTDEQRRFMADVTDLIATYRQIRSGLAVTAPEALRSMPLIPDQAPPTLQQLKALVSWAERNREEIDRSLTAARRSPGPPPQESSLQKPPSPTPTIRWGRDKSGLPVPLR